MPAESDCCGATMTMVPGGVHASVKPHLRGITGTHSALICTDSYVSERLLLAPIAAVYGRGTITTSRESA